MLEPDESNVGLAIMHFNPKCDVVIGVGSGVINDISKIVAAVSDKPYIIVGTAPSMDGYESATSSMTRDGLKISLNSKCADVIIGDVDILSQAPMQLMVSGLGDMLAKYVSICEWRMALQTFLGKGADSMIAFEKKEKKYDKVAHEKRLQIILDKWDDILKIIDEELPSSVDIEHLLDKLQAPKTPQEIGIDDSILPMTFQTTKDIRDKYVLSRLCWDLGIIEEL